MYLEKSFLARKFEEISEYVFFLFKLTFRHAFVLGFLLYYSSKFKIFKAKDSSF